jgi:hypothetical protein
MAKTRKRVTKRKKGSFRQVTAEEFRRLTGEQGSVYFGFPPAKRPTQTQQTQPERWDWVYQGWPELWPEES